MISDKPRKEESMIFLLQAIGFVLLLLAGVLFPWTVACFVLAFLLGGWLTPLFIILIIPAIAIDYSEKTYEQFITWVKSR